MIVRSIRHKGLKNLIVKDQTRGLDADMVDKLRKVLAALILADNIEGFMSDAPPGWRVHRLSGNRQSTWSVTITGNWRLTFLIVDNEKEIAKALGASQSQEIGD